MSDVLRIAASTKSGPLIDIDLIKHKLAQSPNRRIDPVRPTLPTKPDGVIPHISITIRQAYREMRYAF